MTVSKDTVSLNAERNVTLTCMIQSVGGEFGRIDKRPAILILPGGGYSMCSDREAEIVAYPYLQSGYHAFILRYSVKEHRTWPNPLEDYEQAMELIRKRSDVFCDKIAVIGFSAGGHLAACAATLSRNRPNAAILGYAALEQDIASACQPGTDIPSPTAYVDGRTPPCFLFAARDDLVVPIHNTVNFQSALSRYGISFEAHIYAYGGHGFSTGDPCIAGAALCSRVPHWVKDSVDWLGEVFGRLTPQGLEAPVCAAKLNADADEMLSVDCSFQHLRKQEDAQPLLRDIYDAADAMIQAQFGDSSLVAGILGQYQLREFMKILGKDSVSIDQLDAALKQIPNKQAL